MRHLLIIITVLLCITTKAQQHFSITTSTNVTNRVGLVGIGSLNTEELERLNSSGKFGAYYVPFMKPLPHHNNLYFKNTFYVSYNINATNDDDSLLASTVLLPELGNSSFLGTMESGVVYIDEGAKTRYSGSLLFEFSTKSIKIDNEDTAVHFKTINYTLGLKLVSTYSLPVAGSNIPFSFALIPYMHWMNVPDEDYADYRYLLEDNNLPTKLRGIGCKAIVALHNFQFFADMRHTFDNHNRITNREMKGFTSNVGVIVAAPIEF